MAGNVQINFVAAAGNGGIPVGAGKTLGAFLWNGFVAGAKERPTDPPTNQFFQ